MNDLLTDLIFSIIFKYHIKALLYENDDADNSLHGLLQRISQISIWAFMWLKKQPFNDLTVRGALKLSHILCNLLLSFSHCSMLEQFESACQSIRMLNEERKENEWYDEWFCSEITTLC